MEQKFLAALQAATVQAGNLGVRIRPIADLSAAHRCLTGHRPSDGFYLLAQKNRLDLSLEALAVKQEFTGLFSDQEANTALTRLMESGYFG